MQLRHIVIAAKLVVGAGLIYWLLRDTGARDVWAVLKTANPAYLAASIGCFVLVVVVNAVRWRVVFDLLGTHLPLRTAVLGTFEGMFFNLFLPTGVGGDVVRAYRAYDHGLTAKRAAECAMIDRALGLWGLAGAIVVAAIFSTGLRMVPGWQLLTGLAVVVVIGGICVAWAAKLLPARAGNRWLDAALGVAREYGTVVRSARFWTAIVPLLAIVNLLIGLSAWFAGASIGLSAGFADMVIVVEGGALTAMIPISIGGWGVREGTVAFLLAAMGHAQTSALAASALMGIVLAVMGLIGALIWMALPYNRTPAHTGQERATSGRQSASRRK